MVYRTQSFVANDSATLSTAMNTWLMSQDGLIEIISINYIVQINFYTLQSIITYKLLDAG